MIDENTAVEKPVLIFFTERPDERALNNPESPAALNGEAEIIYAVPEKYGMEFAGTAEKHGIKIMPVAGTGCPAEQLLNILNETAAERAVIFCADGMTFTQEACAEATAETAKNECDMLLYRAKVLNPVWESEETGNRLKKSFNYPDAEPEKILGACFSGHPLSASVFGKAFQAGKLRDTLDNYRDCLQAGNWSVLLMLLYTAVHPGLKISSGNKIQLQPDEITALYREAPEVSSMRAAADACIKTVQAAIAAVNENFLPAVLNSLPQCRTATEEIFFEYATGENREKAEENFIAVFGEPAFIRCFAAKYGNDEETAKREINHYRTFCKEKKEQIKTAVFLYRSTDSMEAEKMLEQNIRGCLKAGITPVFLHTAGDDAAQAEPHLPPDAVRREIPAANQPEERIKALSELFREFGAGLYCSHSEDDDEIRTDALICRANGVRFAVCRHSFSAFKPEKITMEQLKTEDALAMADAVICTLPEDAAMLKLKGINTDTVKIRVAEEDVIRVAPEPPAILCPMDFSDPEKLLQAFQIFGKVKTAVPEAGMIMTGDGPLLKEARIKAETLFPGENAVTFTDFIAPETLGCRCSLLLAAEDAVNPVWTGAAEQAGIPVIRCENGDCETAAEQIEEFLLDPGKNNDSPATVINPFELMLKAVRDGLRQPAEDSDGGCAVSFRVMEKRYRLALAQKAETEQRLKKQIKQYGKPEK